MKLEAVLTENVTADDLAKLLGKYYRVVTDAARARSNRDKKALRAALTQQETIENEIEFTLSQR